MRAARYLLLCLLPLAAIWLYAMSRSIGQIPALVTPARSAVSGGTRSMEKAIDAAPVELQSASAETRQPVRETVAERRDSPNRANTHSLPQGLDPGDDAASNGIADASTDEVAAEHPEVTDPRMRQLLQPAWDD